MLRHLPEPRTLRRKKGVRVLTVARPPRAHPVGNCCGSASLPPPRQLASARPRSSVPSDRFEPLPATPLPPTQVESDRAFPTQIAGIPPGRSQGAGPSRHGLCHERPPARRRSENSDINHFSYGVCGLWGAGRGAEGFWPAGKPLPARFLS